MNREMLCQDHGDSSEREGGHAGPSVRAHMWAKDGDPPEEQDTNRCVCVAKQAGEWGFVEGDRKIMAEAQLARIDLPLILRAYSCQLTHNRNIIRFESCGQVRKPNRMVKALQICCRVNQVPGGLSRMASERLSKRVGTILTLNTKTSHVRRGRGHYPLNPLPSRARKVPAPPLPISDS